MAIKDCIDEFVRRNFCAAIDLYFLSQTRIDTDPVTGNTSVLMFYKYRDFEWPKPEFTPVWNLTENTFDDFGHPIPVQRMVLGNTLDGVRAEFQTSAREVRKLFQFEVAVRS
jgi:hypothetical protein